jgi:ubiquinone/menaquinone biosynthesis C-methylase UbiE
MDQQARYEIERAKWDAHAHHSHEVRDLGPEDMLDTDMTFRRYADAHLSMRGMADFLGDLDGKRILEYGCGLGRLTVVLANSGARVTTFDLSEASVEMTRRRAELNGLTDRIEFHVASGEALPFEDGSFDLAVGKAILHHLDPELGARELARVLAPGGRATFSEPLGTNPLVVFAAWRAPFAKATLRPIQLTSMVERAFGFETTFPILRRLDDEILRRVPSAWRLCRYGILSLRKAGSDSESVRQAS